MHQGAVICHSQEGKELETGSAGRQTTGSLLAYDTSTSKSESARTGSQ